MSLSIYSKLARILSYKCSVLVFLFDMCVSIYLVLDMYRAMPLSIYSKLYIILDCKSAHNTQLNISRMLLAKPKLLDKRVLEFFFDERVYKRIDQSCDEPEDH